MLISKYIKEKSRGLGCLLCLLLPFLGHAQSFNAKFETSVKEKKMYLCAFYGERISLIDSAMTDNRGQLAFKLRANRNPGMYRLMVNRKQYLDFIFNKEDLHIRMDMEQGQTVPEVIQSIENQAFYSFLAKEDTFRRKMDVLIHTGQLYPERDSFFILAEKQYRQVWKDRNDYLEFLINKHQGAYVARVLALYREPDLDWTLNEADRREQFRARYFEKVSLKDPALIRSNLLTSKAIDYLSLFPSQQMRQQEAEQAFIKGVDKVLANVAGDSLVFSFMLSYLVGGFEKYKMEQVLTHLYQNYLADATCEGDVREDELARRLRAYEQLAIGRVAPELHLPDSTGADISLAGLDKDYYLLVFWASWCPHCHELLTKLPQLRQVIDRMNIGVVTITLDTSRVDWLQYLRQHPMPWSNGFEGKGWSGSVVKSYNLYATPTMFLLDRQRKIIAKPITWMDLEEAVQVMKEIK